MPVITALEVQKKNKERVNVFVDDGFFCGMSLEDTVKCRILPGQELSESELNEILQLSEENAVFTKALEYILKAPKTKKQLRDYFAKKGIDTYTSARVITRLEELGYVNDHDYARNFTDVKQSKMGARAIALKLSQKGIDRDVIERFVAEIEDQDELAITVARKYMRNLELSYKNFSKLYRYLVSKGFDYELVTRTIETLKGEL